MASSRSFLFDRNNIFQGISLPETTHLLYSNVLAIWYGLSDIRHINPFKPEFTIVIFIHYKPGIDVAILDLQ